MSRQPRLTPVAFSSLAWTVLIAGVVAWVASNSWYGSLPPVRWYTSLAVWVLAVLCAVMAIRIKKRVQDGEIGHDRRQLNPLTVAQWALVGQASCWISAAQSGAYGGLLIYLLPRLTYLDAARADLPGVALCILGGLAGIAAGKWLERNCTIPPDDPSPAASAATS